MSGYHPDSPGTLVGIAAVLGGTLLGGFLLARARPTRRVRASAWLLAVAAVVGAERLCATEPGGIRMLAIVASLLVGMKAVVAVEQHASGGLTLSVWRWTGFALGWPGMRPAVFADPAHSAYSGSRDLLRSGARRLAGGLGLILLARATWVATGSRAAATAFLLPGLSLALHFGLFDVAAGAWRRAGFDCRPLFRKPLGSTSLTEFWSSRWNLAFTDMVRVVLYAPLAAAGGRRAARLAGFLFSGLLHELAISVPVGAGYGLPLTYFVLQAGLVSLEDHLRQSGRRIDRWPGLGRAWTLVWLVLPLPLLFHLPFLRGVLWPIIGIDD